jgi:polyisoprenoid-binding protein YceI
MKRLTLWVALLFSASLWVGNYTVDASHSNVGFKIKHLMISNVKGGFDKFEGVFEYDKKSKTLKSMEGNISVDSINTANAKRDEHLKNEDFFDAAKYPTIGFKLTKAEGDKTTGALTMYGVSKEIYPRT